MKAHLILLCGLMGGVLLAPPASAQIEAPALDYVAVPDSLMLPPGKNLGSTSGVAINSKGNILVLSRGPDPLVEFDGSGRFIRSLVDRFFFDRPHGLRVDPEDNIWATDVAGQVVYKFSPEGRLLLVLGVRGSPGVMHPYGHLPLLNEPNDVAFAPNGDVYVAQGHGRAESRIAKFDRHGNFIKVWGKKGKGPGEFGLAHSVAVDAKGLLYVADRNNQRIQVFDADGAYLREYGLPGTPCGLHIGPDQHLWLAHGHAGQVLKLDLNGQVLGAMGGQGKAVGQFGEAHYIAVSARNEVYVADTLNWRVQKFVPKGR